MAYLNHMKDVLIRYNAVLNSYGISSNQKKQRRSRKMLVWM